MQVTSFLGHFAFAQLFNDGFRHRQKAFADVHGFLGRCLQETNPVELGEFLALLVGHLAFIRQVRFVADQNTDDIRLRVPD